MSVDIRPRTVTTRLPAALACVAVLTQISYPLVHGTARDRLTVVIVVLYAATGLLHAVMTRGRAAVFALVSATVVFGFAVEAVGVHIGIPFGHYVYASTLGPSLLGVPVVIALAWTMLAWPAALVARRLASSYPTRVVLGAWALATWDLFLDPQMVAAGHWRWRDPSPHLPGVPTVPISDYLGWFAVALVISLILQRTLVDQPERDDSVPYALYLWTWASSALGLAVFLDLRAAAAWGALGMGTVAVPLLLSLRRR